MRGPARLALLGLACLASACATTGEPLPRVALAVPFVPATSGLCGPASLAMLLAYEDPTRGDPHALARSLHAQVLTPGRSGALQIDLIGAARRRGSQPFELRGMEALSATLAKGRPVLVMQNLRVAWWPQWHYAVVVAAGRETVWLHTGETPAAPVPHEVFVEDWRGSGYWGLALDSGKLKISPKNSGAIAFSGYTD